MDYSLSGMSCSPTRIKRNWRFISLFCSNWSRRFAVSPLGSHRLTLAICNRYHAQLVFALTKFRPDVSNSRIVYFSSLDANWDSTQIGVAFSWFPLYSGSVTSSITLGAFSTAVPVSLDNLQFERISVLFNIAAMYSALGAQETRNTPEGIKNCIAAFQVSLWRD